MNAKRRHLAPASVMAVDHIVHLIVQCISSPQDVVAFLRAIPAPLLSAPLTALLALLSTSSPTVLGHWPAMILERVDARCLDLALDALAALPAIRISSYEALERALTGRFPDLAAFTAAWPTKVTHLDHDIDADDVDDVRCFVTHCTHLDYMCVHVDAFAELLPFLPSSLRHVLLTGCGDDPFAPPRDDDNDNDDDDDHENGGSNLAPSLLQWLENGKNNNKHVSFDAKLGKAEAAAIANVLALTSSMATLEIDESHQLVQALLASTTPRLHVTSFLLHQASVRNAMLLVTRLHLTSLTRLEIEAVSDLGWVLPLLASMPHLEELALGYGQLHEIPDALSEATPRLRKLALSGVDVSDQAFDALFQWTSGLQQLRSAIFRGISLNRQRFSLQLMTPGQWVVAAGIDSLSLVSGQTMLAPSREGHAISGVTVSALVRALSHVINTTLRLAMNVKAETFKQVARDAWLDFGVAILPRDGSEYDLCSPDYCR
ncbi:hypothetical protein SDRG_15429 [Saprolegnia diclina VS20]|uniref:Uncharacterized protein n=1 Tax=Saprolegnia diclina (strain VS20) TaxID=1156394 RepID=T0PMY8_SAPDV|nr:hypothetical protein SDRG_15429 [Saprolegnia diclina VS20]EQC26779.1 hypothetical protein SDRG_15429 [Saprolegnia diclina VS20]|eukprot:XP_008619822.1 hypothetical protein SDRG_15429 [Saprolegnia diclina VS20]